MKLAMRAAAVVAAITVGVTGGCSGGSPGSSGSGEIGGQIELSFWGSSSRVDKYTKINQLFQQKRPGATVEAAATDFASYFDKLNVQAASKTMPCVTTMQTRQLNDYTSTQTLSDLQPLIDSGQIKVGDIPETVLNYGRGPDGKLYMIPFGVAWNAYTVNTALAEENGITLPEAGYTWDDFGTFLKDADAKLPEGVAVADDQGQDESVLLAYMIANGHTLFTAEGKLGFPKSALADYWNLWQRYQKAGYLMTPQQNADEPPQLEQFYVTLNKALAEQTAGNALPGIQAANKEANMSTLLLPSGSAGSGNMFFVSGYSIPNSCENTATAAAYIDFWTNDDEAAKIFASDNGAVANNRQLDLQIADPPSEGVKTVLQTYQQIVDLKVKAEPIPRGYFAVFNQALIRHYQDIAFGRATVDQAVDAFFDEANAGMGQQ